jgi:hypothetical protein
METAVLREDAKIFDECGRKTVDGFAPAGPKSKEPQKVPSFPEASEITPTGLPIPCLSNLNTLLFIILEGAFVLFCFVLFCFVLFLFSSRIGAKNCARQLLRL